MESSGSDRPYAREAADVVAGLESDAANGLTAAEAAARLSRYRANEIAKEQPPSVVRIPACSPRDR
jgi:Ca2+-transporting ATPase